MGHTYNPSIGKQEGQEVSESGLHSKTLSQIKKKPREFKRIAYLNKTSKTSHESRFRTIIREYKFTKYFILGKMLIH
jgi:hypothetical protein